MPTMTNMRELCGGDERFDAELVQLGRFVTLLHEAIRSGQIESTLDSILGRLIKHADGQFARDELIMKRTYFPGYGPHTEEHRSLVSSIHSFRAKIEQHVLDRSLLAQEVADFVSSWLVSATILGDGTVAMILDIASIIRNAKRDRSLLARPCKPLH